MWPFRRKVEAPASGGAHPLPAPVRRHEWAALPPIQRMIGAHPLTAPADRFRDDLVTHQDPSVTSDTMGHQVNAEAPAGLVLALAQPTTRSDGPAMIPRPRVPRRVQGAVAESGEWDGDEAARDPARPTPLPIGAPSPAARELPVVTPGPAVQRLIGLPPDAEPTPAPSVPQRLGTASAAKTLPSGNQSSDGALMAPAPRLTVGQSRRLGLGAPIKRLPDRGVQRAAADSMPPPRPYDDGRASQDLPSAPNEDAAPALTPVTSSLDLIAPSLAEPRATPRFAPGDLGGAPHVDVPLSRRGSVEEAAAEPPSSAGDVQDTPPSAALQPSVDPDRPRSQEEPSSTTELAPAIVRDSRLPLGSDAVSRIPITGVNPVASAGTAPLVGARPLRPTATLQRSTDSGIESTFTRTAEQIEDHGTRQPPQASSDLPSTTGTDATGERTRSRMPAMPLAPGVVAPVQRAVDAASPPPEPTAMVQRRLFDSVSTVTSSGGGGSAVGSALGAFASSLGSHKAAETDVDELADKVYDRIRARLKTELLVDRERAGFLTDLR